MQQKIVVKVPMKNERDRSTAMRVAAGTIGLSSVKIGGEERDKVIVIGEVDATILTQSLKRKFGRGTTLVMVEPLPNSRRFNQPPFNYNSYDRIFDIPPNNYYNNNMNYTQPNAYYNNPQPPPSAPASYYSNYSYDQPAYDSCSIM